MGIFEMFKHQSNKEQLGQLKALITLAAADGKIEKEELMAIAAVCHREGISEQELKKFLDNPSSFEFVAPKDNASKIKLLKDMVCIMMADGNINDKEMILCKATAEALGYKNEVIDAILLDIIVELKKNME